MKPPVGSTDESRMEMTDTKGNKRKRKSADAFSRVADSQSQAATSGRGSEAGWVHCPLCGRHSRKLFALGRGIAAHLHAVHTPWNPGKVERQKRRRLAERQKRLAAKLQENPEKQLQQQQPGQEIIKDNTKSTSHTTLYLENETGEPSPNEVEDWNQQVLRVVKELEEQHNNATTLCTTTTDDKGTTKNTAKDQQSSIIKIGVDRNGKELKPYRASLPPFLQAAADGDLQTLKDMVNNAKKSTPQDTSDNHHHHDSNAVLELLNTRDRHLSTAEHWAAGSGQLDCLKYLHDTKREANMDDVVATSGGGGLKLQQNKKIRRRDGKTALHYAARNGHVDCIHYLIREQGHMVDERSGDGTTPLHLSCFGGHLEAMKALYYQHGANVLLANDFDCHAAHWIGMTKCTSDEMVRQMCRLLQQAGVSFVQRQKQGHTILHKAAQRQNRHVIEWMAQSADQGGAGLSPTERKAAGEPDEGGHHTPSDIWRSVGGDEAFADWMQSEMGW